MTTIGVESACVRSDGVRLCTSASGGAPFGGLLVDWRSPSTSLGVRSSAGGNDAGSGCMVSRETNDDSRLPFGHPRPLATRLIAPDGQPNSLTKVPSVDRARGYHLAFWPETKSSSTAFPAVGPGRAALRRIPDAQRGADRRSSTAQHDR